MPGDQPFKQKKKTSKKDKIEKKPYNVVLVDLVMNVWFLEEK